jgi:hypothetical protein
MLSSPVGHLLYLEKSKSHKSTDLAVASTTGDIREECYQQQAYRIADEFDRSQVYGVDFVLLETSDLGYACAPFFLVHPFQHRLIAPS